MDPYHLLQLLLMVVVVLLAGALHMTARRGLSLVLLLIAAGLSFVRALALVLISSDYSDADGYADCEPACSGLQDFVAVSYWTGGMALLLAAAVIVLLLVYEGVRGQARDVAGPGRER